MARPNPEGGYIIAAGEVGAFSVCPQSWYLLTVAKGRRESPNSQSILGEAMHRDWSRVFEESLTLRMWVRYLAVLACLLLFVFMAVSSAKAPIHELFQLSIRNRGLQMLLLLGVALWLMRVFGRAEKKKRSGSGFVATEVALAIDSGALLPEREYISTSQGLAGRPDALVREAGIVIPIERKPLARKLRDRYVAQLLVYMRLVEEFEGARPPHGYLLLGPQCRRIKVANSGSKQRWVDELLEEMRRVLAGAEPTPTPHPKKCARCEVRERCHARVDSEVEESPSRVPGAR